MGTTTWTPSWIPPLVGRSGGPHAIKLFVSILNAFGIPDPESSRFTRRSCRVK
jgi:hypothetical protein